MGWTRVSTLLVLIVGSQVATLRVCSVLEREGMEWDGSVPRRRSRVRFWNRMEWPRSTKGNIRQRCGMHPSAQIGRTRWNGTMPPSNLIKFGYN
jgi:hypothetical protein